MARKISFIVTIEDPLHINSRRYQVFNETSDFIPATTLRGALANSLCIKADRWHCGTCDVKANCSFGEIFSNTGRVRFEDLYPIAKRCLSSEVLVLPVTATSCKLQPGFISQFQYELSTGEKKPYDERPHGVSDLLIPQLAYQIAGKYDYNFKCSEPKCPSRLEPFSGFYHLENIPRSDHAKALIKAEVPKRRLVRTAVNREKRTAERNLLFSLEIVEEETQFFGAITVEDDNLAPIIRRELKELKNGRLGGVRSRGLGGIGIDSFAFPGFDSHANIEKRMSTFNHFLKHYLQTLGCEKDGEYVVLGLQSDAILRNDRGEYSALIDEDILIKQLQSLHAGLVVDRLKLVRFVTSRGHSSGWSGAWKLPREVEPTIKRGSVFVFKAQFIGDELLKALEQLQIWGIGQRREEGYGKVVVCDEFHWGFHQMEQDYDANWRY
jgi:CRISPR-associated protein Csx10